MAGSLETLFFLLIAIINIYMELLNQRRKKETLVM